MVSLLHCPSSRLTYRVCVLAGCILAELHTGFPLFPGENEVEQLACIMEVLDLPPEELIVHATRRRLFFGESVRRPAPCCR